MAPARVIQAGVSCPCRQPLEMRAYKATDVEAVMREKEG